MHLHLWIDWGRQNGIECANLSEPMQPVPPETLFLILLDDDTVTDDVVAEHLRFYALLTTLASSMWGHDSSTLTSAAVWVLGKVLALAASAMRSSGFLSSCL